MRIRDEKDYLVKVVNYKGNILTQLRKPRKKSDLVKTVIGVARLYERAINQNFLTKDLLTALKTLASVLLENMNTLYLIAKQPYILKTLKNILKTKEENYQEEIIYGKIRLHEKRFCSICRVHLVYPAYVVYKKNGIEVERSKPIGIKCLNSSIKKIYDLVEHIEINFLNVKTFASSVLEVKNGKEKKKEIKPCVDIKPEIRLVKNDTCQLGQLRMF